MENTIETSASEVMEYYPEVQNQFLSIIKNYIKDDIEIENVEYYFTYGIDVPELDDYIDEVTNMKFEERLMFELDMSYVYLDVKYKDFFISDIMVGDLPKIVIRHLTEVVKIKMIVEYNYNGIDEVRDSVPEIDKEIVSYDILTDILQMDYDIDEVLEKIKEGGIESLSKSERDFLNRKSKDI